MVGPSLSVLIQLGHPNFPNCSNFSRCSKVGAILPNLSHGFHFPACSISYSGTVPFRLISRMLCLESSPKGLTAAAVWMTTEMPWQALLRHWASRMSPLSTVTLAFVCSSVDTKQVLEIFLHGIEVSWHRCQLCRPSRAVMVRRHWGGGFSTEGSINTQKSECSICRKRGNIYFHPIPL